LEHNQTDGAPEAGCVFTVIPGGEEEQARKFLEALTGPEPPVRVLASGNQVHAVKDRPSGVTAICVFDASAALPEDLPVRRVNAPCALMLRPGDNTLTLSAVMAAGAKEKRLVLELAGKWSAKQSGNENAELPAIENRGDTSTLSIPAPTALPVRLELERR
jgi:hypothetical protein